MSMTLINFVKKSDLPTIKELENKIKELGYDFNFITDFQGFESFNSIDSIDCELNGTKTFLEIYLNLSKDVICNSPSLKEKISNKDFTISFTFGSDELVGVCINLVSIGLIDLCDSVVLYADEEIIYTRDMLIEDTEKCLDYIENGNYNIPKEALEENLKFNQRKKSEVKSENIKNIILWGMLFLFTILMQRKIISWPIPGILLVLVLVKSQIDIQKKRKR